MSTPSSVPEVIVVGGGPSGLAAATTLRRLGAGRVIVLEREDVAGGVPRHCGHPPFGMREFRRILTGPRYARRLVETALDCGVEIRTGTSVVSLHSGPRMTLSTPLGRREVRAQRVVLATGARETPRSSRLVSGSRPLGVVTTGALQSMVYLGHGAPCTRPVIVGSELVSFSALLTCRHAGIRPVAMIEPRHRPTAWRGAALLPRLLGVPLFTGTRLLQIEGRQRVTGVSLLDSRGAPRRLDCDGVVFSGCFTAESSLAQIGHLMLDQATGGPRVDGWGRCSDPDYFATGNVLHPANSAGSCWQEGTRLAQHVAHDLKQGLPPPQQCVTIRASGDVIRYVYPQRIATGVAALSGAAVWIRFAKAARGHVILRAGEEVILRRRVNALPERQLQLRIPQRILRRTGLDLDLQFEST
jgi:NADPH-dependent 2,4-dienoyl-CoA reductase/sulfur reductase-like enzyme